MPRSAGGSYVGVGDRVRPEQAYGHPVAYELFMLSIEHVVGLIEAAGLTVRDRQLEPIPGKQRWHAKVWAQKPGDEVAVTGRRSTTVDDR